MQRGEGSGLSLSPLMSFSKNEYPGTGAQTDFAVSFPYIDQSHVTVTVDGVETAFTWVNAGLIRISPAPDAGAFIRIRRETSQDERLVNYVVPSSLNDEDLNNDSKQAFYMAQEAIDRATEAMGQDDTGQWDAVSKRISNVADPQSATDAVNRQYAESLITDGEGNPILLRLAASGGGDLVGFAPYGVLSSADTLQSAIQELVDELAASTGSSLVGYFPSGLGLPSTTVQGQLRKAEFFESIAELRAWASPANEVVAFVRGYYAAGDGGGGMFRWNSTSEDTDNGGTALIPTGHVGPGRWVRYSESRLSVKFFGAKGDGTADDTPAMTAAHSTGQVIYYPAGVYKFTKFSIPDGGIVGAGRDETILTSADTSTDDLITFTGNGYFPRFDDFQVAGAAGKTSGAAIKVLPATGESKFAAFRRVCFNQVPTGLWFSAAAFWSVLDCFFQTFIHHGIVVDNTLNPDGGDQLIGDNCVFSTTADVGPNAIGVLYKKGGGLKIIGNKFLGGQNAIKLDYDGSSNTADLLVIGNSIENQTFAGVLLGRASGVSTFENVIVSDNQFAGVPNTISAAFAPAGFLSNVKISGNVIRLGAAGIGVDVNNLTCFYIGENTLFGVSGNVGIRVQSGCVDGKIGKNTYSSVATTLSNSSTTTLYELDEQSGTASGTTNASYGSLFVTPTVVVTFPVPFTVAPNLGDVSASISNGNGGGVSVMCTAVSTTEAHFICIGLNNASVIDFSWSVRGVR